MSVERDILLDYQGKSCSNCRWATPGGIYTPWITCGVHITNILQTSLCDQWETNPLSSGEEDIFDQLNLKN